ncbi:MAG: flagellar biosynthesis anti-sigma factor FlgM [Candidatus Desulforudis sp.]|nr:flagellar biosynthesis anti-sigma factor FlgM [Desulforudis sp.]
MKIDKTGGLDVSRLYNRLAPDRKIDDRARADQARPGDSVEFSNQARELQVYLKKLGELPPFREELVERLKGRIQEGTYKPDVLKIAEGMLLERGVEK